jgi:hypothetical protein
MQHFSIIFSFFIQNTRFFQKTKKTIRNFPNSLLTLVYNSNEITNQIISFEHYYTFRFSFSETKVHPLFHKYLCLIVRKHRSIYP